MGYLALKWLHIISATLLYGTGLVLAGHSGLCGTAYGVILMVFKPALWN